jgi:hypothetical protein
VGAKLLSHSIYEELDATTARAHVDVEVLPVLKELGEVAENAPAGAFVKLLRAHVLEAGCAARAVHRIGCGHVSLPKKWNSRDRILALIQAANVGSNFRKPVVELVIAGCQAAHMCVGNKASVQLDVRKRHGIVIAAMIEEDGNVAW